ncbi:hypothetical protein VFPFJ_11495 [Purpureocillium lilacinum]|uniref:Uncharacterized protein n=1 Tax=Purpureocillium lilacinum TaxID=33203 RepID=A0A179GM32_PURLI|nr:hypothetical protein VFPFJ_11495 [Purpureocillium lilacinum]OAQ60840.1 hypothetical protein VFPFJ_11495 [Purpureocillium lilacinum]OAQ78373.1 hypothetical protein VFPBJ_06494 [Purpureocillium lilacinum]
MALSVTQVYLLATGVEQEVARIHQRGGSLPTNTFCERWSGQMVMENCQLRLAQRSETATRGICKPPSKTATIDICPSNSDQSPCVLNDTYDAPITRRPPWRMFREVGCPLFI